jgi:hypothetical protein
MTLLAGDIITAARDRHSAFDKQQTPDASALRALSAYVRELHGKVAMIDAALLREEVVVPFPLADFDAGIELPSNRQVVELVGATAQYPNGVPIEIIPVLTRHDRNAPAAAAWQVGSRLHLRGAASDWRTLTEVAVAVIPIPVALVTLADEIALPDTAQSALEARLALFMAMRGTRARHGAAVPHRHRDRHERPDLHHARRVEPVA